MIPALTDTLQAALEEHFGVSGAEISWERPQDIAHGDAATAVALRYAKEIGKSPRDIAEALSPVFDGHELVAKVEIAGPGYINLWLKPAAMLALLDEARAFCQPQPLQKDRPPIIVEYSQPNIAKPLGVHHLISTMVGQSLSNLHRHMGRETYAINHIGDWGTQFGKLSVAVKKWSDKPVEEFSLEDFFELYVRFHEAAEQDPTLDDEARASFAKMEAGDEELRAFWKTVVDVTMKGINKIYDRMGVKFDHTHGESFYEDMMAPIIEEGKEKGVFVEGEKGALIAEFPEESKLPPAVVLKGDGATIYHTRDLATIDYRVKNWHPEALLYVVDVAQQLYFEQLFAMVHQLGWDLPHLEHVIIGRMSFADRSMSTRKGNVLRLHDVLDQAVERAAKAIADHGESIQADDTEDLAEMMGIGSVVYGVLSQNRRNDMVFDWDRFLSFDGNSAPYLQYTHARARSVLRKAGEYQASNAQSIETLSEKERVLVGTLRQFPTVLAEAEQSNMPHMITNFIFQLCQDYNAFYNDIPILKADEPERSMRLLLTELTADVLKTGAGILTLRVPEKM